MKLLIFIFTIIALASATSIDNKHYDIHQSSVDSARNSMQQRLSKLESQQRQYASGGSENYVAGCSSCITGSSSGSSYNTRASSSSSQNRASSSSSNNGLSSDYVGVGIVGNVNDHHLASSRYSSSNNYEQDDLQQRVVPADLNLNAVRSSAYHKSENSEEDEDVQKRIGVGFYDADVNNDRYSYSQRRQQEQSESEQRVSSGSRGRVVPIVYVPAGSTSSSSSQRQSSGSESERFEERRAGQAVPIGNYVSMAVRPGTATVLRVPVAVNYVPASSQHSASQSQYATGSESNIQQRVQPAARVTYTYPSYSTSSSSNRLSGSQQAEKYVNTDLTNYNRYNNLDSASQTRLNQEESQVQERISPYNREDVQERERVSSNIDSSRDSSSVRGGGYTGVRVVPAFPVHTIESTSAQKTAEEREERRFSGSRPTYVATDRIRPNYYASSASRLSTGDESSSQQQSSSGSAYYYPAASRNTQYQQQGSSSQTQYQQAGSGSQGSGYMRTAYGGYPRPGSAASTSNLSTRFGSGVVSNSNDDLHQYMSESERLARIQQQQIAGSAQSSAVSSVDEANRRTVNSAQHLDAAAANFVGSRTLADRVGELDTVETFPGSNFKRVKSWSKQSKWASGSEYDDSGKIKSHSMLSTGESEKHNVNGEESKYSAATTTLENDGKVSTYSIHTP
ncbi:hypothetical protein PVAND_004737 [Polypedilum vanderplanki]|uniref:Uncharacterized protein n=1 Tax=Polypedilum vanderplanki TaxID=319348 RepID=A0A9J6BZ04_POLVA|nr:hypothetical protein PVAND_004737 [Polypedilum vanderplanki]